MIAGSVKAPMCIVDLWRAELDRSADEATTLRSLLSVDERQRTQRFFSNTVAERWAVGRGVLRAILASYVQCDPKSVRFRLGANGKPELGSPRSEVYFNVSHTAGLLFVAIGRQTPIGLDAEVLSDQVPIDELSDQFFAKEEAEELRKMPADLRLRAFYACWTRKEAFLKGIGDGLSRQLNQFQVSVRLDEPPRLISVGWEEAGPWHLVDNSEEGVAATVAVFDRIPLVRKIAFDTKDVRIAPL
jgi:4'-phosphopantetheinyl transferase